MANENTPKTAPKRSIIRALGPFFDILTVFFLLAAVGILGITLLIINDPVISLNPFPPSPLPTVYITLTPSITPTPTATHTFTPSPIPPTFTPTNTTTPIPTLTPSYTLSPTPVLPGLPTQASDREPATPQPDVFFDPNARFPFNARSVTYQANTRSDGCQWLSIAGNVTGRNGEPITDLVIQVLGADFEFVAFSGTAEAFGPSGFEVQIGTQPFQETFFVRLIGPDGLPISEDVEVLTGETCETNIVVIAFVQISDF